MSKSGNVLPAYHILSTCSACRTVHLRIIVLCSLRRKFHLTIVFVTSFVVTHTTGCSENRITLLVGINLFFQFQWRPCCSHQFYRFQLEISIEILSAWAKWSLGCMEKKIGWKILSSRKAGQVYHKIAQLACIALRKECAMNGTKNRITYLSILRNCIKRKRKYFLSKRERYA